MRSTYKIYNPEGVFFITSTIVDWLPVFTSPPYFEILFESIRFSQLKKGLKLYAYVFLDNHFHLIVSAHNLSNVIGSVKGYTAKEIIRNLKEDKNETLLEKFRLAKRKYKTKSEFQVWQESFHPQELVSEKIIQQKIDYIHMNPVRRGLVGEPEDWKYSSAGNIISGIEGVLHLNGWD
ncbi:MAG: transposase [Ignavibacteria bacterium]|nr:transposase [Ignavibacteria bacterium]